MPRSRRPIFQNMATLAETTAQGTRFHLEHGPHQAAVALQSFGAAAWAASADPQQLEAAADEGRRGLAALELVVDCQLARRFLGDAIVHIGDELSKNRAGAASLFGPDGPARLPREEAA